MNRPYITWTQHELEETMLLLMRSRRDHRTQEAIAEMQDELNQRLSLASLDGIWERVANG